MPLTPDYFQYRNKEKGIFQGICKECNNAKGRERYANNPEKFKEKRREYYSSHADQIREHSREYCKKQREKFPIVIRENKKRYRDANKEEINKKAREYYLENHDEFRKRQNEYRNKNRDSINKAKETFEKLIKVKNPIDPINIYQYKDIMDEEAPFLNSCQAFLDNCPTSFSRN